MGAHANVIAFGIVEAAVGSAIGLEPVDDGAGDGIQNAAVVVQEVKGLKVPRTIKLKLNNNKVF